MKLYEIIDSIEIKNSVGDLEIEIENLNFDTRKKKTSSLFFCINGTELDTHELYKEAIAGGAVAFVVEKILPVIVPQILVSDSRKAMALMSKNFYSKACDKLKIITVVGTNGKTTTTHLIASILKTAGKKVGIIGTCGVKGIEDVFDTNLTTPDSVELHKIFKSMQDNGIEYVVMEASAHAIYLEKLCGIRSEISVFTNITQDHLDFFETMENYSLTKMNYFSINNTKLGIINIDDSYGKKIANLGRIPVVTYGLENPSDVFAINYNVKLGETCFVMNLNDKIAEVKLNLAGKFNIYNALSAAACCFKLGIELEQIVNGLSFLERVEGRFNVLENNGFYIVIDFAHTDDALLNLLKTVRECNVNRIILVFGCGGNRDRDKRHKMGFVAEKFADEIIITSDNPRYEEQQKIAWDIARGIKTNSFVSIADRKEAINHAISIAKTGDVVVIAGKGQEQYQEIMGVKYDFNDEKVVCQLLNI